MKNKLISAEWFGFTDPDTAIIQYQLMLEQNFTIKDIGISYTELNYWDRKELLPIKRATESEWRKFNFFDIMWLSIVRELRSFGVTTKQIKKYKESAFSEIELNMLKKSARQFIESVRQEDEERLASRILVCERVLKMDDLNKEETISYFEYWILGSVIQHQPASLMFFASGEVGYWNNSSDVANDLPIRQKQAQESHLSISMNTMMCDLIDENLIVPYLPYLGVMSVQEAELLSIIRFGKFDSVTVTFAKSRPQFVLLKKSAPAEKRKISEVLMEGEYQNIRIVQHKGQVRVIENERKILYPDLHKQL